MEQDGNPLLLGGEGGQIQSDHGSNSEEGEQVTRLVLLLENLQKITNLPAICLPFANLSDVVPWECLVHEFLYYGSRKDIGNSTETINNTNFTYLGNCAKIIQDMIFSRLS